MVRPGNIGIARRGLACLALLAATPVDTRTAQDELSPELQSRIDGFFSRFEGDATPGCVIGVVKDGEPRFTRTYGMANLEHDVPLTRSSVMALASESKHMTAACVLIAVERGELSLAGDVRDHVPELQGHGAPVTIRHLLNHTGGVRDYGTLWAMAGEAQPQPHTTEGTLALLAMQRSLNFAPGTDYSYSNSGYFLLALALERATGRSLAQYARDELFEPLGMHDTRFVDDPGAVVARRAAGHARRPDGSFARVEPRYGVVGASGVVSTIDDLARWERAMLADSIEPGLLARLTTPGRLADGTILPYASGLVVEDFDGITVTSHGGEGAGSSAFLLRFHEARLSVSCLCNVSRAGVAGLAWRTAIALLYGPDREETLALQTPTADPVFVELSPDTLASYAGHYRDPRTRALWTVSPEPGALRLASGGGVSILRPLGGGRFRTPGPGQAMEIAFGGASAHVKVEGQPEWVFHRVQLAQPSTEVLEGFAGTYYSEELLVPWSLEVREGRLHFSGIGVPDDPFEPSVRDEFRLGAELRVSFVRDDDGEVVALMAHTDRVWALRFDRR